MRRAPSLKRRNSSVPPQSSSDHRELIFPVYLKLMTGFPSFQQEDVGAEFLH